MNTKNLVLMALLIGVGAVLYIIVPGINGMKPDFLLTMMFISILLFPQAKNVFLLGATTGLISGLFSMFPGGFVPNIIDKFVTAFIFFAFVLLLQKAANKLAVGVLLTFAGTLISGIIFLSTAIFVFGAEAFFTELFLIVVLPTTVLNAVAFFIINPIIAQLLKRSNFKTALSI